MVGYMDPVQKLNLESQSEYGQVGKDLCHKLNKDSVVACREVVDNIESKEGYAEFGIDLCKRLNAKSITDCQSMAKKILSDQSLFPCLRSELRNEIPRSTNWELASLSDVRFNGFTSEYKNYLKMNNDAKRLSSVIELERFPGKTYKLSDIDSNFAFIREPECFHSYQLTWTGRYTNQELSPAYTALNRLKVFSTGN